MKKFMALLLAVAMLFSLAACKKNEPIADLQEDSVQTFVKPENYASVLLVTINPQFRLYLDQDSKVLAVEAVNDDADLIKNDILFEDKSAEDVVKIILTVANDKGFVKEEAAVTIEITETVMDDGYKNNMLTAMVAAVNEKATELEITVNVSSADSTGSDMQEESESSSSQSSSSSSSGRPSNSWKPSKPSSSSGSSSSSSSSSSNQSSVVSKPEEPSKPIVTYKDIRTGEWQHYKYVPNGYYSDSIPLEKTFFFFDLEETGYGHVPAQGIYSNAMYRRLSDLPEKSQEFARENDAVIVYNGVEYCDERIGGAWDTITDLKIENNVVSFTIHYYVYNEQVSKEAVLTMEQISDDQLKVISLSNSHPMIEVGDLFHRSYTSTTIDRPIITNTEIKGSVWKLMMSESAGDYRAFFFTDDLEGAGYGDWANENSVVMGADGVYKTGQYRPLSELQVNEQQSYRENGWVIEHDGTEYYNTLGFDDIGPIRNLKIDNGAVFFDFIFFDPEANEQKTATIKLRQTDNDRLHVISLSVPHPWIYPGYAFERAEMFEF